ncbi:hypothetical protein TcBrA4_0112990 [Trypanosoma cruzi]|nr:hypothetical protein TcBrA4_0112990 [Trypanosoma cruzi]
MVALPFRISRCLSALWDEATALVELAAPFYRQLSGRIFTDEFRLSSGIADLVESVAPTRATRRCPEVPAPPRGSWRKAPRW